MIVKITQDDINRAKQVTYEYENRSTSYYCRSETCPLAFALKRLYPSESVRVLPWVAWIGDRRIELSQEVQALIKEIDKKKDKIRPREVEITF